MEQDRFFTNAELAQAELKVGEILVPNSPHDSNVCSDGEENASGPSEFASSGPLKYQEPSGMQSSNSRRKRHYMDMMDQDDPTSFIVRDLRQAFDAADDSIVSLPATGTDTESPEPTDKSEVTIVENGTFTTDLSHVSSSPDDATKAMKAFCVWNSDQKKRSESVALAMKALTGFMATSTATSILDFNPFKLPVKLAKTSVAEYQYRIRRRCCIRDVVKAAVSRDMLDGTKICSDLALVSLNALAFNSIDHEVSTEAQKMLTVCLGVRNMVESFHSDNFNIPNGELRESKMALEKQCLERPKRIRPSE